jgi:hypothetical protein
MVRVFLIGVLAAMLALLASAGADAAPEIPVLTSAAGEFQPARGPSHFAWEQNTKAQPRHYDVFVQPDGGSPIKVNAGRSNGALGGIDGNLLVYQQFRRNQSDILFFDLATGQRSNPPAGVNSRHWEYWPSVSGPWLLYARRMDDQRRLILFNTGSGELRTLDKTKPARSFIGPGQVNGDYVVWSSCKSRCNVYRYHVPTGSMSLIPNPGGYQRAPSVTADGTVYYARGGKRCGAGESLVRSPIEGPETVLVQLPEALGIGDTYAFTQPNGSVDVFFDRISCGRPAASDILKVSEPPPPGTLTIVKDQEPDSDQDVEFDVSGGPVDPGPNFFLDDDESLPSPSSTPDSRTFSGLPAGTYAVQEVNIPMNWVLVDLSCSDPDGGTTWDLGTRTATIDLDPREHVTCTFENVREDP